MPGETDTDVHLDPEVEELYSSRALLLVLVLLILGFWVSYYLKVRRIKTVHETLVALFIGMFVGFIVSKMPGVVLQNMISFKNTILLNVLLPPIILASGYDLKEESFFRNFGVILTFAFCGTFISAVVIGTLVYIWALLGLEGLSLGIIECLAFGSTLSATDPVTVLAIFNTLKVDPKLYSIIFGESLLNDAVAIVMFETLSQFHGENVHVFSFFHGVGIFLLVFLISMALGVVFGLSCSLMLKHSDVSHFHEIEACLVLLIAYASYFFSNALTMSGIVSLLFCGITLKHYAYHNMSRRTQRTTKYMFSTLSSLAENFIFIYLGLSLFTQTQLVYKPLFIIVTGLAVCVARYCAVFPISKVINLFFRKARGTRQDELPHSYQMMLFWSGLRGAVGVALAAGIKGDNAVALRTTVLVTVVMTMAIFGGTTTRMIEIVGIRTGLEDLDDDSSDEEGGGLVLTRHGRYEELNGKQTLGETLDQASASDTPYNHFQHHTQTPPTGSGFMQTPSDLSLAESDDEVLPPANSVNAPALVDGAGGTAARVWRDGQWFTVLDEQYLLPVFSNATASRKQASRKAALRSKRSSHALGIDPDLGRSVEGDLGSLSPAMSQPGSPWLGSTPRASASGSGAGGGEGASGARWPPQAPPLGPFNGSFGDAISALVSNPLPSPSVYSPASIHLGSPSIGTAAFLKKRGSDDRLSPRNLGVEQFGVVGAGLGLGTEGADATMATASGQGASAGSRTTRSRVPSAAGDGKRISTGSALGSLLGTSGGSGHRLSASVGSVPR